jgi:hypothetical protein
MRQINVQILLTDQRLIKGWRFTRREDSRPVFQKKYKPDLTYTKSYA